MIALSFALVALSLMLGGALIAAIRWEHNAVAERDSALTLLDDERKVSAEWESKFKTEAAAHSVTARELDDEQHLRAVAEAQRNAAERKARAYLTQNLAHASEEEINATVRDLFTTPLSIAPGDALIKPGDD